MRKINKVDKFEENFHEISESFQQLQEECIDFPVMFEIPCPEKDMRNKIKIFKSKLNNLVISCNDTLAVLEELGSDLSRI